MSPGVTPAAAKDRAINPAHRLMSFFVYPTTVGFPVVPLEACNRTTSLIGAANIP